MQALAKLCVRRPVFATMLILSLMVVGAFSYFTLGVDLLPKVKVEVVIPATRSDEVSSPSRSGIATPRKPTTAGRQTVRRTSKS